MIHDLLMLIVEVAINIAAFYLGYSAAKERKIYGLKNYDRKIQQRRVVITVLILILITIIALILDILTR